MLQIGRTYNVGGEILRLRRASGSIGEEVTYEFTQVGTSAAYDWISGLRSYVASFDEVLQSDDRDGEVIINKTIHKTLDSSEKNTNEEEWLNLINN